GAGAGVGCEVPVAVGVGNLRYPGGPKAPRIGERAALPGGARRRAGGGPHIGHARAGRAAAGRSEQAGRGQRGGQPRGQQARPPAAASGSQFLSARVPVVVFHVVSPVTGWMCACESWLYAGAGFGPVSIAAGPFPSWQGALAPPAGPPAAVTGGETVPNPPAVRGAHDPPPPLPVCTNPLPPPGKLDRECVHGPSASCAPVESQLRTVHRVCSI